MIKRYARAPMLSLWSEETRTSLWCLLEVSLARAQATRGEIPSAAAASIAKHARFDARLLARSKELEAETRHDVVAFLRAIEERMTGAAAKHSRFLHYGATSSDILDSALSIQLVQAATMLEQGLVTLIAALKKRAQEHKHTPCLGRSHGMAAEPTTFGLKLLSFYAEFRRAQARLRRARDEVSTISLSGTVGHYAFLHPQVEQDVADYLNRTLSDSLSAALQDGSHGGSFGINSEITTDTATPNFSWGLRCEDIATQVIPRDRHAMFFSTLGVIASSLERLSLEIRHLQRSEVGEVSESFTDGQTGSSAMPHKRNPILSENVTGLARLVRMPLQAALENVALWHERDISHSSVERVIAPDTTTTLDFAIARMASIVSNLRVFPQRMAKNLEDTRGVLFSHGLLLRLLDKGLSRKRAYAIVQRTSILALEEKLEEKLEKKQELAGILKQDKEASELLSATDLSMLSDNRYHTRHVDTLFERVLAS